MEVEEMLAVAMDPEELLMDDEKMLWWKDTGIDKETIREWVDSNGDCPNCQSSIPAICGMGGNEVFIVKCASCFLTLHMS